MAFPSRLSTVVKNTSGGRMFFGFLGPRGVWLNANESYTEPGNLMVKFSPRRTKGVIVKAAIVAALQAGNIEITHTNSPIETGQTLAGNPAITAPNYFKATGGTFVGVEFDPSA